MISQNKRLLRTFRNSAAIAGLLAATSSPLSAQVTQLSVDLRNSVEEIVVTGTRFEGRTAIESPTPIDLLSSDDLLQQGRTDLTSALKLAVPSLNTSTTTGSTFSDFAAPVMLRGLSPGQVLVLVNGKRRHTIGEINQSNSLGRGDVTYDLNGIPTGSVGRIEIVRDGASAQYGSDAIAGVINLVLDESLGGSASATVSRTGEGDGDKVDFSVSYGLPVGDGGVVRASAQVRDQESTNRAGLDTRQQYLGSNGTTLPSAFYGSGIGLTPSSGTLDPREATIDRANLVSNGTSPYEVKSGLINVRLPLQNGMEFHGFAGYSRLDGTSDGLLRRSGQDENVRSIWPNGHTPVGVVRFDDFTVSAGLEGGDIAALAWEISSVYGGVKIDTTSTRTNNPSFGAGSPTSFFRGGTDNRQWTTNLDLGREIAMADGAPLKLALGFEFRKDFYELIAGEPASYENRGGAIIGGPNNGRPAPGAQPVTGIAPRDAVDVSRSGKAVYAEAEKTVFDRLTLTGALRFEDYSDFGSTTNYKFGGRFELTESLSVRANYGTGFRAPALAQSYFATGSTSFINGVLTTVRIFSVNDPAVALVGGVPLKPEKSRDLSGGLVFSLPNFTATIDAYRIAIRDRIVISSQFQDARITSLLSANGFPGIAAATFLTNAVDSVTKGIDVTTNYLMDLGGVGELRTTLAANFNDNKLTRVAGTPAPLASLGIATPLFDLTQQVRFSSSQPKDKIYLGLDWDKGPYRLRLTNVRYGEISAVALTGRTPAQVTALTQGFDVTVMPIAGSANSDLIQNFRANIVTSLEAGYRVTENVTLTAGVDNVFDIYPEVNLPSTVASVAAGTNGSDNGGSVKYNSISPFGFNGRTFYASVGVRF